MATDASCGEAKIGSAVIIRFANLTAYCQINLLPFTSDDVGGETGTSVKLIAVTAEMAAELAATVEATTGQPAIIGGFRGRFTPPKTRSLSYVGNRPEAVGFEMCVMLARQAAIAACGSGYIYGASDFVEEMRQLNLTVGGPHTQAVGRDIVFYWPTLVLAKSGRLSSGHHRGADLAVVDGQIPLGRLKA